MPRFKQTFSCLACGHSAWREVIIETPFVPLPDPVRLGLAGKCSKCNHRGARVEQVMMNPKWSDAFAPGGHRFGLVDFAESAARDAEIAAARKRLG